MKVQIHDTKQALRIADLPGELTLQEATDLVRDLMDAITQCGYELKMTVDVPRHMPTEEQLTIAVNRVAHLRRTFDATPWNDVRANRELVQRVLEACL